MTGRLYSFVTVGRFGTEALALLSAVQVVIRPAALLCLRLGVDRLPGHGGAVGRRRPGRADAGHGGRALMTAGGSLAWSAIVVQGWPWISSTLYHGRYAEIGPLGYALGRHCVSGSSCVVLNTAMLAVGEFRRLALIDLAGAVVTVVALTAVVMLVSYPYTIVAGILGQAMQVALMALLLRHRLKSPLAIVG